MIDIERIRADFPILQKKIHGKPLVYLDNAATTQKPSMVLDKIRDFYAESYSNIHRGVHYLSEEASAAYEGARETVKNFIHAGSAREIVFTRGTTEAINLVADSFGRAFVDEGDEILLSEMEHHSNIVPWQMLCERQGARLKVVSFDDDGALLTDELKKKINERTKLISMTYVSNVLGTVNNVEEIIELAHAQDVPVLIDGAQAVQHFPVDVQDLGCDFFAFSGHKMYAETGIGVLYGKEKWLEDMPPYHGGGGMIRRVGFDRTTYAGLPYKFEAGTGSIGAAVSLSAAMEYLKEIGLENVSAYERGLINDAAARVEDLHGVTVYGKNADRCSVISFNLENVHSYDAGAVLDKLGIAVRTGKLCAEPVMEHFGVSGMVRASFAVYNTQEETDRLIQGIRQVQSMMGR